MRFDWFTIKQTMLPYYPLKMKFLVVLFWCLCLIQKSWSSKIRFIRGEASEKNQKLNESIPCKDSSHLRHVVFNVDVFHVEETSVKLDERQELKRLMKIIPLIGADVWGFNEWPGQGLGDDFDALLKDEMKAVGYEFASFCGDPAWKSGNAVFVRTGLPFEVLPSIRMNQSKGSLRCAARVRVDFQGHKVLTITTHLDHIVSNYQLKVEQIQEVLKVDSSMEDYVLLGGDLNSRPTFPAIKEIQKTFTWAQSTYDPPTYTHFPYDYIDYIFYKNREGKVLVPTFMNVYHSDASDHIPVIVDFSFNPAEEYYRNKVVSDEVVSVTPVHPEPAKDESKIKREEVAAIVGDSLPVDSIKQIETIVEPLKPTELSAEPKNTKESSVDTKNTKELSVDTKNGKETIVDTKIVASSESDSVTNSVNSSLKSPKDKRAYNSATVNTSHLFIFIALLYIFIE